jgi:hypothetical protein
MAWLDRRAIEFGLLGTFADMLAGPGLSTDTAGRRRYLCGFASRPDHLAAGFALQPFRQLTSRRIGVRLRCIIEVSIIDGYVTVDIGDMRVVRCMAAVADLTFNHRDQWFVGGVFAVTLKAFCVISGGGQLIGTQRRTYVVGIIATKEPATIAIAEFFAFSI